MRKTTFVLVLLGCAVLFAASGFTAHAELGDIVYEFDAPETLSPRGLSADDNGLLYCSGVAVIGELVTPMLYVIDTAGGVTRTSFIIDYPEHTIDEVQPRGCAWDGQDVWVLDAGSTSRLLLISSVDGSLLSSFGVESSTVGVAYFDNTLYCLKYRSGGGTIIKYDTAGAEQGRIELPSEVGGISLIQAFGLAADGENLFCSAKIEGNSSLVFRVAPDGSCDSWFEAPQGLLYELAFDGLYVWSVIHGEQRVVRIDVGRAGETGTVAVQVNNGSEYADKCSLAGASVTVSSGGAQTTEVSDDLGRVFLNSVSVAQDASLTISKPGFQDQVSDSFSVAAGSMNIFEYELFPEEGIVIPCDSSLGEQWGLFDETGVAGINAPAAWSIGRGDINVITVAIISTGIDLNHPDLRMKLWVNPNETDGDGVDNDSNGFTDDVFGWSFTKDGQGGNGVFDEVGVGTAVAGIIAAEVNNTPQMMDEDGNRLNMVGVNWGARLMPLKFDGSRQAMWKAMKYAVDQGAGLIVVPTGFDGPSAQLEDGVGYAASQNVLVVAGSGDTGGLATYPASITRVLSVGAIDRTGHRALYSNVGDSALSRKIDVMAPGGSGGPGDETGIFTTLPTYSCDLTRSGYKTGFDYVSGTAYSAAFAAGVCALYKSHQPGATVAELASAIKRTARYIDDPQAEEQFSDRDGLGAWNNRSGYGLIDAYAALSGSVDDKAPLVEYAGFGTSNVSAAEGGDLYVYARVSTPDGKNDISNVELFFQGTPTGILMHDDGVGGDMSAGDGIYTFYIHILPGMFASGQYLVGVLATDSSGQQSDMWPYLTVRGGLGLEMSPSNESRSSTAGFAAAGSPFVETAGYGTETSVSTQGGILKLTAEVSDPDGSITGVELFLEGQSPLGIWLRDDGSQGDDQAGDGIYTLYTGVGPLQGGQMLLELVARDNAGQPSDTWPYLVIH